MGAPAPRPWSRCRPPGRDCGCRHPVPACQQPEPRPGGSREHFRAGFVAQKKGRSLKQPTSKSRSPKRERSRGGRLAQSLPAAAREPSFFHSKTDVLWGQGPGPGDELQKPPGKCRFSVRSHFGDANLASSEAVPTMLKRAPKIERFAFDTLNGGPEVNAVSVPIWRTGVRQARVARPGKGSGTGLRIEYVQPARRGLGLKAVVLIECVSAGECGYDYIQTPQTPGFHGRRAHVKMKDFSKSFRSRSWHGGMEPQSPCTPAPTARSASDPFVDELAHARYCWSAGLFWRSAGLLKFS